MVNSSRYSKISSDNGHSRRSHVVPFNNLILLLHNKLMTLHLREIDSEGFILDGHLSVSNTSELSAINISDNSFWMGDETLISLSGGKIKFKKRNKSVVPPAILQAGVEAGHESHQVTTDAALAHAGVGTIEAMTLSNWYKYFRTLKGDDTPSLHEVFSSYTDDDFEETRIGIGVADPTEALDVSGNINFSGTLKQGGNPFVSTPWTIKSNPAALSYAAGNIAIGGTNPNAAKLHIGPFDDDHLYLASANNDYGWKFDTADYRNGDVPFRIKKRTGGAETTVLTIKNENGYVGIGSQPSNLFHIYKAANEGTSGLLIEKAQGGTGAAALFFGVNDTNENPGVAKAAIFYERNNFNGRGDIKFCNNQADDASPVTTEAVHTRMIIKNDGKIGLGIGEVNPTAQLTVSSIVGSSDNAIPAANMGENTAFPPTTHLWLANKHNADNPYWGLAIGTTWEGASYIQNLNKKINTYYNLLLQPNGGNVGVGTTTPSGTLEVSSTRTGLSGLATNEATLMISCTDDSAADDGDIGGGVVFRQRWNNPTATLVPTGGIYGYKDRNSGSYGGGLLFTCCPNNGTGGVLTEVMRLTKEGNVGVGTTNPATKLHVETPVGTAVNYVRIGSSMNDGSSQSISGVEFRTNPQFHNGDNGQRVPAQIRSGFYNGPAGTANWGDAYLSLLTTTSPSDAALTEALTCRSGRVGIGTTNPVNILHVDEGVIVKSSTSIAATGYNHILNGPKPGETTGGAQHFINGTGRTDDGGESTYTIRNDHGPLRLGHSSYTTEIVNGVCSTDFEVATNNTRATMSIMSKANDGCAELKLSEYSQNYGFNLVYDGGPNTEGTLGYGNNKFHIISRDNSTTGTPVITIPRSNKFVGIGTSSPSEKFHLHDGRMAFTHGHTSFSGLITPSTSDNRSQFVMTSNYTDLVLASKRLNDHHGSTISFTSVNPTNGDSYRKFVIGTGNWGARPHVMFFGYSDTEQTNPHLCYGDHASTSAGNVMRLDGISKNVEVFGKFTANTSLNVANSSMHIVNGDGNQLCFKNVSEGLNDGYSWGRWAGPHHYDVYSRPGYYSAPLYLNYYSNHEVRLNSTLYASDDRIKTNERYIADATATLIKLKPQIYTKGPNIGSESDFSKTESGLIAQDVYYDTPELRHLVTYNDDAEIPDEKPFVDNDPKKDPDYSMWGSKSAGVDYIGLIAYLVQAVKENEADKKILNERISALESALENVNKN